MGVQKFDEAGERQAAALLKFERWDGAGIAEEFPSLR